jgi:hypothetical protein
VFGWTDQRTFCVKYSKTKKMKQVTGFLKAALPIAVGVAGGMLIYEQIKKATAEVA